MAQLYFAKVSINSEIFNLYEDPSKFHDILMELFVRLDGKRSVIESGNEYKFNTINKDSDEMIITGRLSKIFDGEIEYYDRTDDKPDFVEQEDLSSSSTFCFDVNREIVAFTRSIHIGQKMFANMFSTLLNQYFDEIEFETFIIQNVGEFKERMKSFKRISKVTLTLIPPNPPNKKEFQELFGLRADEVLETRGTKLTETIEISSKDQDGITRDSKFFETGYKAIEASYGSMSVHGKDFSDIESTLVSEENVPYTVAISNQQKNSIDYIREMGEKFIKQLFRK